MCANSCADKSIEKRPNSERETGGCGYLGNSSSDPRSVVEGEGECEPIEGRESAGGERTVS